MISIITASYNYEKYIKETIESVISQTISDWEMIIIDDGSKDNSVEIINSYAKKDSRIKLIQHNGNVNKGLIETIKQGIKHAKGEWIVFLESDDTIVPDYLEEKLKITETHPNIKFIFNDVNMFPQENISKSMDCLMLKIRENLSKKTFPSNLKQLLWKQNVVPTFSAVMLKKEILNNVDYNSILPQFIDYYLWSQLAAKYEFYFINKKLTNWRMHPDSYANSFKHSLKLASFHKTIRENLLNKKFSLIIIIKFLQEFLFLVRKSIIRIHFKEGRLLLFGNWYQMPKLLKIK